MNSVSVTYDLKWQYNKYTYYKWSKCGKLFNTRTGRQIKKVVNGRSVGYWIKSKFITLKNLKKDLELIPEKSIF